MAEDTGDMIKRKMRGMLPDHPDFAPGAQPFSEFKKDLANYNKKRRKR